jgi:hypothetical protein
LRVPEVLGHVEVGVHAGLEHWDAPQLAELRGVRLVIEGAGDQHIEPGVPGLSGSGNKVRALDGAELGTNEDSSPFFCGFRRMRTVIPIDCGQ